MFGSESPLVLEDDAFGSLEIRPVVGYAAGRNSNPYEHYRHCGQGSVDEIPAVYDLKEARAYECWLLGGLCTGYDIPYNARLYPSPKTPYVSIFCTNRCHVVVSIMASIIPSLASIPPSLLTPSCH